VFLSGTGVAKRISAKLHPISAAKLGTADATANVGTTPRALLVRNAHPCESAIDRKGSVR